MLARLFPALREAPVRRYFAGQVVSTLGTWIQVITLNLLAWQLSKSPALLGGLNFLLFGPIALFAPLAGARIRPGNSRAVTICTVAGAVLVSLLLAGAWALDLLGVPLIAAASAAIGVLFGIELPARQVFLASCVRDREHIGKAVSMNTLAINGARMVGPAIAAGLFAWAGALPGFLISACASACMLACMAGRAMELDAAQVGPRGEAGGLAAALAYARSHRIGSLFLPLLALVAVFAGSYHTLVPVLADLVYGNANRWSGAFLTAAGCGALAAALTLSSRYAAGATRRLCIVTPLAVAAALTGIGGAGSAWLALPCFALVGFGLAFVGPGTNAALQQQAPAHLRGGLAGLYVLCHIGLLPFGYLMAGLLAQRLPVRLAFVLLGATLAVGVALLLVPRWKARGGVVWDGDRI